MDIMRGTGRSTRGYLKSALYCCRNPGVAVEIRDHFPARLTKKIAFQKVHELLEILNVPHSMDRIRNTIAVHPIKREQNHGSDQP